MHVFPSRPTFQAVRQCYAQGLDPVSCLGDLARTIRTTSLPGVWISLVPEEEVRHQAALLVDAAKGLSPEEVRRRWPLFGIPFAVKDNMDVCGMETTAACPAYAYVPQETAFVVQRLLKAGAVFMGKTNMDQFATGLVGVRSPYGACPNSVDPAYISGGSSSGSAHVVARGLVSFSLGTDTAGSGRVPAALNNIIGLKPSCGILSSRGIVPACPSLDCVAILALTCQDAAEVLSLAQGVDEEDIWSRPHPTGICPQPDPAPATFTFGVPDGLAALCDNTAWIHAFEEAVARLTALGGTALPIDYAPYREAADMLYFGPYFAERTAVLGDFVESHATACDAVVRHLICDAGRWSAVDMFRTRCRTRELKKRVAQDFAAMDFLLVPTVPQTFTIEQVRRDPVRTNVRLGTYTNFVNILDLCAVAVPSSLTPLPGSASALPFGISLIAPAFAENRLLALAAAYHKQVLAEGLCLGAPETPCANCDTEASTLRLALCQDNAGLRSLLLEAGASQQSVGSTAPCYQSVPVPGKAACSALVRVPENGTALTVELWDMPRGAVGVLLERLPEPVHLGTVLLADGTAVKGCLADASLLAGA